MSGKAFLDSNVLVYAYDSYDPRKQAVAQDLLRNSIVAGNAALSTQVLNEFYVVVTQRIKKPIPRQEAQELIQLFSTLPVVEIDLALVHRSIDTHQQYRISYWDAMIIAAAAREGCTDILSEDLSHGQRYSGMIVQNPFRQG